MLRALLPWHLLSVRVIEASPFWIDLFASSIIIIVTPVLLIMLIRLLHFGLLPLESVPFMRRYVRPIINLLHRIVLLVLFLG